MTIGYWVVLILVLLIVTSKSLNEHVQNVNTAGTIVLASAADAASQLTKTVVDAGSSALHAVTASDNLPSNAGVLKSSDAVASVTSGFANANADLPRFMPETVVYNEMGEESGNTWDEQVKNLALEPEVAASHERFVKDRYKVSSGASIESERSDRVDVNSWVGLRPPNYAAVKADPNARTVPSYDYEEGGLLAKSREIRWN
jgi:hypothetical protein